MMKDRFLDIAFTLCVVASIAAVIWVGLTLYGALASL